MTIGGLDIGSTGAKITIVNSTGKLLHKGYRDYPVSHNSSAHEINAAEIWNAVQKLLQDAAGTVPDLAAVGVTSFGESFVLLGKDNEVLLPTMMYTDPRGEAQSAELSVTLGGDTIGEIAGTAPHPMFTLPKLMWVKQNRPDIYGKIKHVLLIGDFIVYMLTGRRVIDYSLAARTMGFDIQKKKWSAGIFKAAGINQDLFSSPVPSGTDAGIVKTELAAKLSLPDNLRVVICGHDQITAAVGSNVLTPGKAANGAGTVECITPVFTGIPKNAALQKSNYAVVPFLNGENYCCYAFLFSGGSLTKWFVNQLAPGQTVQAKTDNKNIYEQLEKAGRDEPSGILVLPHFSGAATPYMDTGSKGAFLGLELSHTASDLFRAVMEGITYEMMLNIEKLSGIGVQIMSLSASGGSARSEIWLQMKADILGIPITRLSNDEAGTIGGIILTGKAIGAYDSLEQAADALVKPLRVYEPRREMYERYQTHYQRYRKLYNAVRPLIDSIE
jgi:xylulokinase